MRGNTRFNKCMGIALVSLLALAGGVFALGISDVNDEGDAWEITTAISGTFYLQKNNGGLSSLVDGDGQDWIGFNYGSGASGIYRGIPNMVYPENIGHPGHNTASCSKTSESDNEIEITCNSNNGCCTYIWTFTDAYAKLECTQMNTHNYWFLYEGTPGGAVEGSDVWITSDGSSGSCSNEKGGDIPSPEWIAFADANNGRSILLTHHQDDNSTDKYYLMHPMTVFGFGRDGMSMYLSGQNTFNVALLDETEHSAISPIAADIMADDYVSVLLHKQIKARKAASPFTVSYLGDGSIQINMKESGAHTLNLYTLTGRLAAAYNGNERAQYVIQTGTVSPGAYLLRCKANGTAFSRDLIIE
ncbi:MAG: hypothetical protein GF410_03095 [Chitinivibrionales bacterium]|nr:hypothetical protein [Chitinivibrionales bacterium]